LFYAARPELAEQPFAIQMAALLADGFSFGDAWKHYLEATGRYEVIEVITNAEPAQKQWAKEHGLRYAEENWSEEILAAQLVESQPDIWFCHDSLPAEQRLRLRRECPSIRFAFGYDGVMRHDPARLMGCEAVLSCEQQIAMFYTQSGFRGYWLPWGFDPRLLEKLAPRQERHQVSFCGSMAMQAEIGHFDRPKLLDRLLHEFDVHIFCGELSGWEMERLLMWHLYRRKLGLAWRTIGVYPAVRRLRRSNSNGCFGVAMFQTLADSKVSLNLHMAGSLTAGNIRLFETTGVGTCLLTDWKENLPGLFELDREVVAFRSHEECAEKLRYLLDHENERRSIAAAGQKRCLRDHNIGTHILGFANEVLDKL
jgi:hypothetical protein